MIKFKGKGAYGAIAIGRAKILKGYSTRVKRIKVASVEGELLRLNDAKALAREQLNEIYNRARAEVGDESAQIFQIHLMMLDDEDFCELIANTICTEGVNAEWAVSVARERFSALFSSMDDPYMRARASDIEDISRRLIQCLENGASGEKISEKSIICASDLSPSETILLGKDTILGFATALGSESSHTAILARNMAIPAVVSLGDRFLSCVSDGDLLCVDGYTGEVIINPDPKTLEALKVRQSEDMAVRALLEELRGLDSVSLDGTRVKLFANVGSVREVEEAIKNDAEGIGLFRSEFLYLGRDSLPSEDEQFEAYRGALLASNGRLTIIRTLDIGADKRAPYLDLPKEENPALGLRAIRICLRYPEIFRCQLRALLRASVHGRLGIMFPMITSKDELEMSLDIYNDVKRELLESGVSVSDNIELGIMIETPASALISEELAPLVDFFSVGTNDLTQYTLACDRQSSSLDDFCDTHHEAIFKLIEMATRSIHENGGWIGICGELGGDLSLTERFLRIGIDELSVPSSYILKLRDRIRKIDLSK